MNDNQQQIETRFRHLMSGKMGEDEREQLLSDLSLLSDEQIQKLLKQDWAAMPVPPELPEELYAVIMKKTAPHLEIIRPVHRVHFLKTAWFRWAAAVIVLFGIGTYIFTHTSQPDKEVAIDQPSPKSNDILPGFNRAILTLSDGKKVELDSAASETISDGNLEIQNNNGQLIYQAGTKSRNPDNSGNPSLNTMSTPRGGTYQLILPDGSGVWLNAESSITFPTAFTGNSREVQMTGEVYFEVNADAGKPFIVKTMSDNIQVLGTSFNVNAYAETPVKTSLMQGSVKINTTILKPGQAYVGQKIMSTNIEQDLAWKNGRFDFTGMNARQVMNQVGRWYDVTIQYKGNVDQVKLGGSLKRSVPLSDLLEGLEGIGGLHFTIDQKTVIVSR